MNKFIRYITCSVLLTATAICVGFFSNDNFKTAMINLWFDLGTYASHNEEDLHKYSQWSYLTQEEFADIVRDGISKLNKPLTNKSHVFELGVGVGAALKIIAMDYPNIQLGGSDFSANAIEMAKTILPESKDELYVHDMAQKHDYIADNTYDCVLSFGALAMYLTEEEMVSATQEAIRITKPGGSLLFTHFIEPDAQPRRSIVTPVDKAYWENTLPQLGGKNIRVYPMLHQGDRYQVSFTKVS